MICRHKNWVVSCWQISFFSLLFGLKWSIRRQMPIHQDKQACSLNCCLYKVSSVLVHVPVPFPTSYRRCWSWMPVRTPQLLQTVLAAGDASARSITQAVRSSSWTWQISTPFAAVFSLSGSYVPLLLSCQSVYFFLCNCLKQICSGWMDFDEMNYLWCT